MLVLIPWSAFWDRNYFVAWSATLSEVIQSNYTRGAVSGLGLVNVWAAMAELAEMFRARGQSGHPPSPVDPQSEIRHPQ